MSQTYTGDSSANTFVAPTAEDWTFIGKGGNDNLTGNVGNDTFFGGFGNDILDGGPGDDIFNVGLREGVDRITGGVGFDRIVASGANVLIGLSAISGVEEISANGFANVSIMGSVGADILDFSGVTLVGISMIGSGAGDDTLISTEFADTVNGGTGTDTIRTLGGDDTIVVGFAAGYDSIDGGTGFDTIAAAANNVTILIGSFAGIEAISANGFSEVRVQFSNADDVIDLTGLTLTGLLDISGGGGNDTITGTASNDVLSGGNGDDIIRGGTGNDTLNGNNGLDILEGGMGDDIFLVGAGGSGKDIFRGGVGFDTVQGNADFAKLILDGTNLVGVEAVNSGGFVNFTIEAAAGGATFNLTSLQIDEGDIAAINGSFADDNITGSRVADTINGNKGNDILNGGLGDDTIDGGEGDDTVNAGAGFDIVTGGEGNDTLLGFGAADDIDGGAGNDIIDGGTGDDTLRGGAGDDIFRVDPTAGFDSYDGGAGFDAVIATKNGVKITFSSIVDIEAISSGGFSNVVINGGTGADVIDLSAVALSGIRNINGLGGDDVLTGSAGNDTVLGGIGIDRLLGGDGVDTLSGGAGVDFLTGGGGDDIFRDLSRDLAGDTITDFAIGDRISVQNFVFSAASTAVFAGGMLRIDADGAGPMAGFNIKLLGTYNDNFDVSADPLGGLAVTYIG